ncbi:hypothetical protein H310_09601 [Aphanomyces invadans]|uniref:Tc1-like transposase DDE domain-containing protein n=1 Tax=Aphanomyces invadans TaxID=157072 RepID=A0A024TT77_9STRA|nr:hypothetical protein H310_09601 [Aphanomyces invadans]ETV97219.1 hypothetical protein H310_09601 [Aphanomyces invadans]|eukprot:XP_008873927.1 hypothetical protein H310_09601 [Aphanomyces invadans]
MYSRVHIDEKWFFLTKEKRTFYVYEDEELAHRAAKSKRVITKVMFLDAVARPRYDHHLMRMFDGKLGIWPFVQRIPAARNSKNRPKGTLVTTPLNVDAKVYTASVLNNVVPAIAAKFPRACLQRDVLIQQDNASPHRVVSTEMLVANGVQSIGIANQPPNSPDFNVLDLGCFNEQSLVELPVNTLAKTFITLPKVMECALLDSGGNNFKMPHMKKGNTVDEVTSFQV